MKSSLSLPVIERMEKKILERLNELSKNTLMEALGIEVTNAGNGWVEGKMPVDHRTKQPLGLLHGGASVAFAESLASFAGSLSVDHGRKNIVGMEINANHIRSVKDGYVYGRAECIHMGKKSQVWETRITDERDKLVCISRMTLAVVNKV